VVRDAVRREPVSRRIPCYAGTKQGKIGIFRLGSPHGERVSTAENHEVRAGFPAHHIRELDARIRESAMDDQGWHRESTDEDPDVPDELIEAVCRILGLPDEEARPADLPEQLREVAVQYLIDLSLEPFWGTPKEQRAALRKLWSALDDTLDAMLAVAPEYAVALDSLLDRERRNGAGPSIFDRAQQANIDLRHSIARFDAEYQPKRGRPADLPLEEAVRKLIDIVEPFAGEFPKVQFNKHKGGSATLKSRGARAIGALLQGIHPSLKEKAIAHMIEKIRRQPWQSESHVAALFRLDPDFELDCSLLGRDRGD
jgi:hypothetical protein